MITLKFNFPTLDKEPIIVELAEEPEAEALLANIADAYTSGMPLAYQTKDNLIVIGSDVYKQAVIEII